MKYPLPLYINVRLDTLDTLIASCKPVNGCSTRQADVRAAVVEVEQLVRDRQPADPAVVDGIFRLESVPSLEDLFQPGLAEVSVEEVAVLLAYAKREIEHAGWCFNACDDEDLETQLPADSIESCPVCHSVYEIEKHVKQVQAWRQTFLGMAHHVMHHEKSGVDDEAAGQKST